MKRIISRAVWVGALLVLLFIPEQAAAASGPAPVFRPVLAKLRQARTPVYLPSWLPRFEHTVYPLAYVGPKGRTYEIDLSYVRKSVGTATLAFYLTANVDVLSPGPNAKHVALAKGVTGLIGSIPGTATNSLTAARAQPRPVRRRRDRIDEDAAGEPLARSCHRHDAVSGDLHSRSPDGLDR